ncbi:MAG: hypothetical protein MJE12_17640 [Alphaproteobacteria bacterium]|nr:hypothetical protein [Alphaproteobacteria bacterium]
MAATGGPAAPLIAERRGATGPDVRVARDGPVRLMPRRDLSSPSASEPTATPPADAPPLPDIQVKNLDEIDPDAVGTLDESAGGYGTNMWLGTPRHVIERLLGRIPATMKSPTMRSLAQRLLLSVAALPPSEAASGVEDAAKRPSSAASVLVQRVERLQAMGLIGDAGQLIKISPNRGRDPDLQRLQVENMLLVNDVGGACGEAQRDQGRLVEPYWQRLVIFCQLLAGNKDAATFGATILAENDNFEDAAFLALVDRLSGSTSSELDALPKPTPLHLAMLRSANAAIPADAVSAESPPILRTVGISPNAALDVRLKAAERAALFGAISPARLGEIYMSVAFDDEELNNALSVAEKERTPRGRALLFRSARSQSVPTAKAAVMQRAFELARADVQLSLVIRLYEETLLGLPVSAELAWFASTASRVLLALGKTEAAEPWLTLLQQRAHRDKNAQASQSRMWALGLLAGEPRYRLDDPDAMARWLAVQREMDPKAAEYRAGLALTLFDAMGMDVPTEYWQMLLREPRWRSVALPSPAFRRALDNASIAGRRGETVLLTLLILGREGPALADIEVLQEAVVALQTVELEEDARALVLEAALANGL